MKRMRSEMKIFLGSRWFILASVLTAVLCFLTPVYYGEGITDLSVLELFRLKAGHAVSIQYDQYQIEVILARIAQGYVAMFVPVLSALSFVVYQHAEKTGRYKRFFLLRCESNGRYYRHKWLCGMISGGLTMVIGIFCFEMVFFVIDRVAFPSSAIHIGVGGLFYLRYYAGVFLYGAVSAIPAMLISMLCNNLYFVICIPFISVYMYNLFVSYLSSTSISTMLPGGILFLDNLYSYSFVSMFGDLFSFVQLALESVFLLAVATVVIMLWERHQLDTAV